MHRLAYLARLHDEGRLHALAHADEVVVYGRDGQQRGDGHVRLIGLAVGEDDVVVALVHRFLRPAAEVVERLAQAVAAFCSVEEDGQLDGVEALVADVAEDVELGVVQYRMRQAHHLAVGLVGIQDARAHASDILRQAHHQLLADGVDGGVGHLGKLLAEVVEERLRPVGEHGQRRVVAHRGRRLLAVDGHRHYRGVNILGAVAEHQLLAQQVFDTVLHMPARLQLLQLYAVCRQPLAVGMLGGQLLLDLSIIVYPALLGVYQQYLARLQTALLGNLRGVEVHHAHLRGHHHHVALGDGVACGAQAVAVEHAAREASVAEEQGRRAVPRLHQDGVVLVEGLQVLRDGVLVVERLRHEHAHGMGQRQARHHKELQHVVERGGVRHARLHDGGDVRGER